MNRKSLYRVMSGVLVLSALGMAGCGGPRKLVSAPAKEFELPNIKEAEPLAGDGVQALTEVLEKYGSLKTFQSTVSWNFVAVGQGEQKAISERLIFFERPNKHRVMAITGSMKFASVSDGTKVLEYAGSAGKLTPAPSKTWQADAENIRDPQIAGSFLFQLFRGPADIGQIVEARESVSLVPTAKPDQIIIRFKARGRFGTTELTLDKATKTVSKITSLFEPLVEDTAKLPASDQLKSVTVTETFSNVKIDAPIGKDVFSTVAPPGAKIKDESQKSDDLGVLSEGMKAPDFELASLDGKRVKLSDLQGQVVLLDFWATWCVPCREALPKTLALDKKYRGKGLSVWSIPEEDAAAVNVFLQDVGVQGLPVLLDPGKKVSQLYRVSVLPTYVVIDQKGMIHRIYQGAPDIRDLLTTLRDAGLPI